MSSCRCVPASVLLLVSILLLASSQRAMPATFLVLEDGSGDLPTIQAAVDMAAASGDTVLVGPGTYVENVVIESKAVTLLSQAGRDATTIQGDPAISIVVPFFVPEGLDPVSPSAIRTSGNPFSTVVGFTFHSPTGSGGVFYAGDGSRVEDSRFDGCGKDGAQAGSLGSSSVTFAGCTFNDNEEAGVRAVDEFAFFDAVDCEMRGNGEEGAYDAWTLERCDLVDNGLAGARASLIGRTTSVIDCFVSNNGSYGLAAGAVDFGPAGSFGGAFDVQGSVIANNTLHGIWGDAGVGGATSFSMTETSILDNGGPGDARARRVHLTRCVYARNSSGIRGRTHENLGADVEIVESTFHDNGGGIDVGLNPGVAFSALSIERSIVSNTQVGGIPFCDDSPWLSYQVDCTNLFGNAGGDGVCSEVGDDNFSADPLFCDADGGDLRLAENSPCAPANAPVGCGLVGALPVGCAAASVGLGSVPTTPAGGLRVAPNPIRGSAVIDWEGAADGELRVYDALGRLMLVRRVSDLGLEGGVEWDRLVGDAELSRGVYYLELAHPTHERTRVARIVLLR